MKTSQIPFTFDTDLALYAGSLFEIFEDSYGILFRGHLITNIEDLQSQFTGKPVAFSRVDRWFSQNRLDCALVLNNLEDNFFVWSYSESKGLSFLKGLLRLIRRDREEGRRFSGDRELQTTFNQLYQAFAVNIADEFLFSYLLNLMMNLVHAEVGSLQIFREKDISYYSMGFRKESLQHLRYNGKSISDFLFESKSVLFIADTATDSDFHSAGEQSGYLKSVIFVPVIQKGSLVGVFYLVNKASNGDEIYFNFSDLQMVQSVLVQVGSIISNALLYQTTMEIKEFNEEILENIPAGVLTVNGIGEVLFINQYLRDFLLKTGKTIADLILFLNQESLASFHNREMTLDEDKKWILNVSKRFIQTTNPGGLFLYILSDMSAQKQMEWQLARTEKLAIAGELMSGLAHEIKNPLTAMKGFADLMGQRQDDPEFVKKFARIVSTETDRLNHLLEKLLSFARPNLGLTSDVNLQQVVDQVFDILSFNAKKNNITLINEIDRPVLVPGNAELLTQIFMNLILNSIQALMETDQLSKEVRVFYYKRDSDVEVCVWDNGPGISKEEMKNVFNPFYTTKPKGTGLGLSITYRLITEHRGEIHIESEKDKFTLMRILLPLSVYQARKI